MKVIKKVLPNGLTVLIVQMKESASVTVDVSVRAGSFYETKETSGISHFLEHMCFKGTTKRPLLGQIARELDEIGAGSNASTGNESTSYFVRARPQHLDHILDIVSDIYLNSTFPEIEIEKEKGVVCDEIAMYEDDPQSIASDLLLRTMYGNQSAGWDIGGTKENVRSFTKAQILSYRKTHYVAAKTVVTIVGKIDPQTTYKKVMKMFKDMPTSASKELSKKVIALESKKIQHKERVTEQTHIRIAFKGLVRAHKDKYVAAILASILGHGMSSRLFIKMREELGISYYVGAYHRAQVQMGRFGIYTGVASNKVESALLAIRTQCERLKKELVGERELKKIQEMYTASLFMGLETSSALADYVSGFALDGEKVITPKELEAKFKSVTAVDIQRVAKVIFKEGEEYVVTVGATKK